MYEQQNESFQNDYKTAEKTNVDHEYFDPTFKTLIHNSPPKVNTTKEDSK